MNIKHRLSILLFLLTLANVACATEATSPAELRASIRRLGPCGGTIELVGENWTFGAKDADKLSFYISNHDQSPSHRVNLPLFGCTNLTIRGRGQTLLFDEPSIAVAVIDSRNVRLENVRFDWVRPFITEMKVVGYRDGKTVGRIDEKLFPFEIRGGRFVTTGRNFSVSTPYVYTFRGDSHEIVDRTGDVYYRGEMTRQPDGTVLCDYDFSRVGAGLRPGDVVALRPDLRPNPAMVVYRSSDTSLADVVLHAAWGMGVLVQMSENFAWLGSRGADAKTSGVFPPEGSGRCATLQADATHFSNVKGLVDVSGCWFEGMMDDAINVHSTCLGIQEVLSPTRLRCRYMHFQALGFGVFRTGDRLRFIRGKTLENGPVVRISRVDEPDERTVVVDLTEPVPAGYAAGDAVENADFQCAVRFCRNMICNNRARGTLFTTPHPVLVESNRFVNVSGSAILFAADAQNWYESGACENVVIRGNLFRNCLTVMGQFCNAIISSCPTVTDIDAQTRRYHRNILIEDNVFETHSVPLFYALSTENVVWRNNTVKRNGDHIGFTCPAFILDHCAGFQKDKP